MADVERRMSGGESAKRKHIVWNEENLSYNEANKSVRAAPEPATASPRMPRPQPPFFSHARVPETLRTDRPTLRPPPHRVSQAKMKIDEPDTPWASPPKELFEDPEHDGADVVVAMDDVADRLKAIDTEAGGSGGAGAGSGAGPSGSSGAEPKGEWDSSDDEDDDEAPRRQKLAFPDPGGSGGSGGVGAESGDDDDDDDDEGGALDDADRVLKARLFEAQRKSHQCTFRGMMARGRALLDEDEDEGE